MDEEALGKIPGYETLKRTMRRCELKMRELEPINMKAIEEYETQQKRHSDLIEETKQLKDQRRNLIRVMKELEEKKKVQFGRVFEAINENFKGIFAELSVDGEAELLLENPEKPFDGGLIIKARPRGKKVLRLESLSGGEKSLTALALIFAIQAHEPSPFYLLDEVDMFLDAINAENVARMVKKNSRLAQSVMISLRKITMKEADYIYGVTMKGNSISDVIGNVNLQDVPVQEFTPPPEEGQIEDISEEKAEQGDLHA
jgi:chromosome segregation protein